MPFFIATQTSPPADHDMTAEVTRMIANTADEAEATKLFQGFAQPGHKIALTDDVPDSAWVQKQRQAGKLLPGMVMNDSASPTKTDPKLAQHDMMRLLYMEHDGDKAAVVAAYAKAETEGRVA